MIRSALVQIKGYSFYLDDIILVTPITDHVKRSFNIILKGNLFLRIQEEGPNDSFDILYDMLYNRRIVTSTPNKTSIDIKDLDTSNISIHIILE